MKKTWKKIISLLLAGCTVAPTALMAACDDEGSTYDAETRPLVMSIDAVDQNFNPFFATSQSDSTVAAMTQIGMITMDAAGNPVCGDDQPTVALSYTETMKTAGGQATTDGAAAATTEYEFVIKNGIKFSDGTDLTIQDVLFNLYVYLDPAYDGSATIYSTDIVGLKAYRSQNSEMSDDSNADYLSRFYTLANQRISNIHAYLEGEKSETAEILADIATVKALFLEEVKSDWNANAGSLESYQDEYLFTEDWEVFYFVEGIISVPRKLNESGNYEKETTTKLDANGQVILDEDGNPKQFFKTTLDEEGNQLRQGIEGARNDAAKIAQYMTQYDCTEAQAKEYIVRDYAIEQVYNSNTTGKALSNVLYYWATGGEALEKFAADEKTKYYASLTEGVPNISGISQGKKTVDGVEHDTLKIEINGVDPKAIWNFAFTVAPMAYYGGEYALQNYNGVNNFGVKLGDASWFASELKDPAKNGLPVGAGTYKASNDRGDQSNVNKDTFCKNNVIYFERNTYFDTVGGDTITNAKIKYLRYKVVGSNKIINALETKEIDLGNPSATPENIAAIGKIGHLDYQRYETNGYGYVGINPKYVPDIEVRRAIMTAMNTNLIITDYYGEELAKPVYRSLSITNWAYPTGVTAYNGNNSYDGTSDPTHSIAYNPDTTYIANLVESVGYTKGSDGVYVNSLSGHKLKYVFTIAGETKDHPAYAMFEAAADILNSCGFDITVTTSPTALSDLAKGTLTVWAAAWSSPVDPDLYQVYHKDSTATSIKNWGYKEIFADSTGQFSFEQTVINNLSTIIEEARETINPDVRKEKYGKALDLIMELAVELPTYQRNDLTTYNKEVIDTSTLNRNASATSGVTDKIWAIDYN
ncbi:MAG: hypothetical protein IJV85_00520 [Clostridia bacterium]|nr:hypothetical protein [Clostridia bacterium]